VTSQTDVAGWVERSDTHHHPRKDESEKRRTFRSAAGDADRLVMKVYLPLARQRP
jgi:hypothetical protein